MTAERIKEIQQQTAYPDSISVQQALLQVWNECSRLPQQETLYTEEQVIGFAKWIAGTYSFGNIFGKWYLHENTDKEYTEKELFDLYIQSLKQPKQ